MGIYEIYIPPYCPSNGLPEYIDYYWLGSRAKTPPEYNVRMCPLPCPPTTTTQSRSSLLHQAKCTETFLAHIKISSLPTELRLFYGVHSKCAGCALKSTRKSAKLPPRKAPSTGREAGNTAKKRRPQRADRRRNSTPGVYITKAETS
jgi:hypothetical protein